MYEYLTAMAAQEHVRDLRATADRYRLVAEARQRMRRRDRAASESPER
jgi:hypothetical protein